ncbi:hypothetical protein KCV03_g230, partial [Aureobasidium melanogenum]
LANGNVVTGQDVSVEELASGLVCLHVGTTGEDLGAEESGLVVAVVGSVNGSVAIVDRRGEAIGRLNALLALAEGFRNRAARDGVTLSSALLRVVRGKVGEAEDYSRVVGGVQVLEGLSVARGCSSSGSSAGKGRVGKERRGGVGRRDRARAAGLNGTGTTSAKSGRAGAVGGAVRDIDLGLTSQDRSLNGSSSRVGVVVDNQLISVGRNGDVGGSLDGVDQREVKLLRDGRSECKGRSCGQESERAHDRWHIIVKCYRSGQTSSRSPRRRPQWANSRPDIRGSGQLREGNRRQSLYGTQHRKWNTRWAMVV